MKTSRRNGTAIFLVLFLFVIILVAVLGILLLLRKGKTPSDPHEGQVYLYDGYDWIWMTPLEGVPVNELTENLFSSSGGQIRFVGEGYDVLRGVDVSEHQQTIDWAKVAASGVDYAYIRLGWRGYTEGGLFEDVYFNTNLRGAIESGLKVGVYFFSQAITVQEAIEEAEYVLSRIDQYRIDLPVVFDWEKVDSPEARTAALTVQGRTDCAVAFCETVRRAGYSPCVYFNRNMGYYGFDLTRLTEYEFWFSLPESSFPNFYYTCDMWQYSFDETVPGIEGETDMNLRFIKRSTEIDTPTA
ncbi:MAG: glycoside hydrolase family 25 protein [Oscillospiraceae bacterium]|nr:glycoside hydrolase family 25 protein [Oscillospiraceae bacterium]